jgi:hypothetical protein
MLADALVERYSRQILLPEVGGRGQERLCAAQVVVTGSDEAARTATDLLRAAGITVVAESGAEGAVAADAGGARVLARWHAGGARVVLLLGRPCEHCLPAGTLELPASHRDDVAAPTAVATGALVAAEALRAILGLADGGRSHALDLTDGAFAGTPLGGPGCARCRAGA